MKFCLKENSSLSLSCTVPLSVTVQYKWKIIQISRKDSAKGEHDRLIELRNYSSKGQQISGL